MNRRDLLLASAATTGAALTAYFRGRKFIRDVRPSRSRVAVLSADQYSEKLDQLVYDGIRLFDLDVRGKSVLLKPNLVEYIADKPVNTDTQLIGAAVEAFLRLGAASVTVAEGPGHHRDTELLLFQTGLGDHLIHRRVRFVDLNRDGLAKIKLQANYSGLGHLWLPRTVLTSDFIVSMPKVKTHHWTGVTLSMKNMFGIVPGSRYGWPKNVLHWAGIHESVLDICATIRPHFVIADAIVAMEGDGPLNGSVKNLSTVLLSDDPVAADSILAEMLGFRSPHFPNNAASSRTSTTCKPRLTPLRNSRSKPPKSLTPSCPPSSPAPSPANSNPQISMKPIRKNVMLFGGALAAVRLVFLWAGTYFLSETSGWLQIPGYFMLMGTLPEALLVRQFRIRPIEWQLYLSVLLVLGSFAAVLAVYVLGRRLISDRNAP